MMENMFKHMQCKYRAARQVVRLYSGDMTPQQEADVASWKQQGDEFQKDFLDTVQGLADMEALSDDPDILAMVEDASQSATKPERRSWPGWAAAAALVLAISLTFNVFGPSEPAVTAPPGLRYVTTVGEQKTVELSDGSLVTLNTGTELLVTINEHKRQLVLRRGEAYFEVAKDLQRPFSVEVHDRSVTALGTEFNILKTPESATVAVLEGVVSLHKSELQVFAGAPLLSSPQGESVKIDTPEQHRIKAGWVATLDVAENQIEGHASANIARLQSWRSGQLRFNEEPLSEVIRELNRYSAKKILIEDASIMDLKVYAVMRVDRIDLALTSLEKTLPIKVVRHFDRTILVNKK